jgi:CheY-like chemotaxis protein
LKSERRFVNRKILFVDDEPAALKLYKHMLNGEFDIVTAPCGEDAIAMLDDQGPFAIVISDLKLQGMDGAQFLKRMQQLAPNTVRLLLTGRLDLGSAVNAVNEAGIFRLLLKPCDEAVLTEAVTTALACYHQRKEERVRVDLAVRVCRPRAGEKVHAAQTVDISNSGVRLAGLNEPLEIGEILTLECGTRKAPFRVVWVGTPDTTSAGQAGLVCLAPDADVWKLSASQLENEALLDRARVVQCGLLPHDKPPLSTLDYAGDCIEARMVGGDYYDFLELGPGEVGFVLADVSGKGVPAALLMASLQGNLQSQRTTGLNDLPKLLASLNAHIHKHSAHQRYVTLFFGRYNDATQTLHYVNCGHNPPALLRRGGAVERLEATSTVLGLFLEWECSVATAQLGTGDILIMYTDGITETTGDSGEEFGESRLLEIVQKNRDLEAAQMLRSVEEALEQFRVGEQEDDMTLVIARAR